MTISDSCFTLFEAITQFQQDIAHYTASDNPLSYSESLKRRLALIQSDLEAVRMQLDHSPSDDTPVAQFDPISPRLKALQAQSVKWRNNGEQLSHEDYTAVEHIANTALSLPRWLEDMEIDIWEDPKD